MTGRRVLVEFIPVWRFFNSPQDELELRGDLVIEMVM